MLHDTTQRGSALSTTLVILLLVAVGVGGYISGKKNVLSKLTANSESSSDEMAEENIAGPNPVLAKLDGEEIKRNEVLALVRQMPPQMQQMPVEQLIPVALEQLISNKVVDEMAQNAGLENDPRVMKQVEQAKEQFIRSKFVENEVASRMTDERVQEEYKNYVEAFPEVEEVKAAHILVEDEKLAKDIIAKLGKGADFAELAKENSKDGSAAQGGELGYFSKTEVVPEFADAAFATEVGSYTKKPVKSNFGYHVIKIEDKRQRQPAEYAQVKPYIEQELKRVILDEALKEWTASVDIERFDINGNPLQNQEPAAGSEETASEEPAAEAAPEDADAAAE